MEDILWAVAIPGVFFGWIAMQVFAIRRMRGGWRMAAFVPLAAMGAAFAVAVLGGLAGSNLAPIWVVFALPPSFLWLAVLWLAHGAWAWAEQG